LQQFSLSSRLYHTQREFRERKRTTRRTLLLHWELQRTSKKSRYTWRYHKDRSEYWPARSFLV
jgi:hypothetical protein